MLAREWVPMGTTSTIMKIEKKLGKIMRQERREIVIAFFSLFTEMFYVLNVVWINIFFPSSLWWKIFLLINSQPIWKISPEKKNKNSNGEFSFLWISIWCEMWAVGEGNVSTSTQLTVGLTQFHNMTHADMLWWENPDGWFIRNLLAKFYYHFYDYDKH